MPEPQSTGPESTAATSSEESPETQSQPQAQEDEIPFVRDEAAWGFESDESDDAKGDPDGGKPAESQDDDKGDPGEESPAGPEKSQDGKMKFAGKFETPEQLEEGYRNQQKLINEKTDALKKAESERDVANAQNAELREQFAEAFKQSGEKRASKLVEMVASQDPKLAAELKEAMDDLEGTLGETSSESLTKLLDSALSLVTSRQDKQDALEAERQFEADEAAFKTAHPEANEDDVSAKMKEIAESIPDIAKDPMKMRELILNAAKGALTKERVAQLVQRQAEKMADDIIKKRIASGAFIVNRSGSGLGSESASIGSSDAQKQADTAFGV